MNTYVTIVEYDLAGSMAGLIAYAGNSWAAAKSAGEQREKELSHQSPLITIQIWENGHLINQPTLEVARQVP